MMIYKFTCNTYTDHIYVRNWASQQNLQVKAVYDRASISCNYQCSKCDRVYQSLDDICMISSDDHNGRVYSSKMKCCKGTNIISAEGDIYIKGFYIRIVPNVLLVGTFPDVTRKIRQRGNTIPSRIPAASILEDIEKDIIYPRDVPQRFITYHYYGDDDIDYEYQDIETAWDSFISSL